MHPVDNDAYFRKGQGGYLIHIAKKKTPLLPITKGVSLSQL